MRFLPTPSIVIFMEANYLSTDVPRPSDGFRRAVFSSIRGFAESKVTRQPWWYWRRRQTRRVEEGERQRERD